MNFCAADDLAFCLWRTNVVANNKEKESGQSLLIYWTSLHHNSSSYNL